MEIFSHATNWSEVRRPLDIKYMQYTRRFSLLYGAWPGKLLGEVEFYRLPFQCFNVILITLAFVSEGMYLRRNFGELSFFDLGQTYITELMTVVTVTRLITLLFKKYDRSLKGFLNGIHLFHFKDKSSFAMKTHLENHKLCHYFALYEFGLILWTSFFFNIPTLYNNMSKGGFTTPLPTNFTYEHSVYYVLPFDYQHEIKGYTVIAIFNCYISFFYAVVFGIHDLVLTIYMFQLWGHLKILVHNLENIPRPTTKRVGGRNVAPGTENGDSVPFLADNGVTHYSAEELEDVAQRLKDNINHHVLILRFIKDISDTYGPNVFIFYAFEQVTLCVLLVQCTHDIKALMRFGPLTLGVLQLLIVTSMVFELLSSMTDPLMRAVYNVPWECMDPKNRRTVLLMMMQTQKPLGLKAMGLVDVGVQTAVAILKTTISYFVILRTVS